MSRVAKKPVELGKDLTAEVKGQSVTIKGKKGSLTLAVNSEIEVKVDGNLVKVAPRSGSNFANAMAGTTRAHIANMVAGVTNGFQKKLDLVGVLEKAEDLSFHLVLDLRILLHELLVAFGVFHAVLVFEDEHGLLHVGIMR